MSVRLLLICHAATAATRRGAFPQDEALDERGEADAVRLRSALPAARSARCGPSLRCRQTATALGLSASVEPMVDDWDMGSWRGRTLEELESSDRGGLADWLGDPDSRPHDGESLTDMLTRVASWLADSLPTDAGRVLVVTHPAIIRGAIVHALQAAPEAFWRIDVPPLATALLTGHQHRWNLVLK